MESNIRAKGRSVICKVCMASRCLLIPIGVVTGGPTTNGDNCAVKLCICRGPFGNAAVPSAPAEVVASSPSVRGTKYDILDGESR